MLMSLFWEVLFLDADVLCLVNAEVLFEDPEYQQTKALFFRDRKYGSG